MTITAALAAFFRRPGVWAYLTRRAELTYLRERDVLLHSERMAVIERLKPGAVLTEFGSGCYRRIWMAPVTLTIPWLQMGLSQMLSSSGPTSSLPSPVTQIISRVSLELVAGDSYGRIRAVGQGAKYLLQNEGRLRNSAQTLVR